MTTIKHIGVLTSGGDAPGMNAAIRAVVRTGVYMNVTVTGICRGYEGLINNEFVPMQRHSVSNIIQRGGTILKTARSERFMTDDGQELAYKNLVQAKIDALVAIGGDGTFRGAMALGKKYDFPIVGVPGTIDNDLYGTDFTIGYDTAINTVVEAVDKLRDTAASHDRLFFVEVMGRDAGFIALRSGIACGAEEILVPETQTNIDDLIAKLENDYRENKSSGIIIVAEGDDQGGAFDVARKVKEKFSYYDTRVSIIGHMQRGGTPTCMDRVLASTLGYESVMALMKNEKGVMVGQVNKTIVYTPFEKATKHHLEINTNMLKMARILSL
ncbi:MAG TPA: 6-phosphofructokinase [Bacteroidales bacterium]|nr:6-phosphofructokinase [Bacteroidales bacterium]HQI69456.1 6-phosphofructokinase [Bacteroidales bacterium]